MLMMEIPGWFIDPYGDAELADSEMQWELVILSASEELRVHSKRGHSQLLLRGRIAEDYPSLCSEAKRLLLAFPSSYLVEKAFSVVVHLITKKRNRLVRVARGDLGLNLTELDPISRI